MAYEQGNIPDLRSEHREHRFSWKALVVVLITVGIVLVPIFSIAGWI
ncbi:hypothetical protein BH23ACT4_BH23ACT4_08230 [soil metagenome]